jgi:hypothetical protein
LQECSARKFHDVPPNVVATFVQKIDASFRTERLLITRSIVASVIIPPHSLFDRDAFMIQFPYPRAYVPHHCATPNCCDEVEPPEVPMSDIRLFDWRHREVLGRLASRTRPTTFAGGRASTATAVFMVHLLRLITRLELTRWCRKMQTAVLTEPCNFADKAGKIADNCLIARCLPELASTTPLQDVSI